MSRRVALVAVLVVMATLVFQVSAMAQGCAMCRAGYESSPDIKVMAPAINHGIVFLMGAPYVLLGTVGLVFYRAHRKKKAEAERPDNPYIPRN